jgi:hypothetical protein
MAKVALVVFALGATGSEGRKLGSALKFGRTPEDVVATECVDERCALQSCNSQVMLLSTLQHGLPHAS